MWQFLIEFVIQQFVLCGVINIILMDIVDVVGVICGVVYWYFVSKMELFNEMWQQQLLFRDLIQFSQVIEYEYELLNVLCEWFIVGLCYIVVNF